MKLEWIILGLLIAMWIVLAATVATEEAANGHGVQHPAPLEAMDQGGPGAQRHGHIMVHGWLFGSLSIAVFTCVLALGARRSERVGNEKWYLMFGGACYIGVYTAMFFAYRKYLYGEQPPEFLGQFPEPTTLMLWGIWGTPLLFVVFYVWQFDRWVFSAEDEVKFRQLVTSSQKQRKDSN